MDRLDILAVKELGDKIGYGNMMHIASALWGIKLENKYNLPPDGAFVPALITDIDASQQNKYLANRYNSRKRVSDLLSK